MNQPLKSGSADWILITIKWSELRFGIRFFHSFIDYNLWAEKRLTHKLTNTTKLHSIKWFLGLLFSSFRFGHANTPSVCIFFVFIVWTSCALRKFDINSMWQCHLFKFYCKTKEKNKFNASILIFFNDSLSRCGILDISDWSMSY